ncbi:MAG TPA: DUF962 domain-containing protein [Chitinophagales bacterium]|nr:DUF962 domain-containing protein [Chitinophagales bacterium]
MQFNSVKEFYPYYLTQHREIRCRTLHFTGTSLVIVIFITAIISQHWWLLLAMPVAGYGFAWTGHFLFEKNKPAAFNHPLYSFACDFIMFWHIITGRINEKIRETERAGTQS